MPITFKSKHAPDILMLESIALQLIRAMGYSGNVPGAIAAEDITTALQRLEDKLTAPALNQDKANDNEKSDDEQERPVSMAHRALPLINMLHSAAKHEDYVIWE